MGEILRQLLLRGNDYMPHGYCYLWNPWLVWLHVISDSLIALSYYSIPFALVYFVRKRRDLPYRWVFVMFGLFIASCGTTHAMAVWNVWNSAYWVEGAVKAVTAVVSVATAILLVWLIPGALRLPSQAELALANERLHDQLNERREVEMALAQSEARLRRQTELLDLAHDAIMVRNYEGRILYWNHGAEFLYGWPKEQALGQRTHDLLQTTSSIPVEQIIARVRETSEWEGKLRHRREDGKEIIVHSRWVLRPGDDGQPESILEINRDITEREAAEEKARTLHADLERRHTELAAMNRELETFSYSVSHDLRAPLRHIDGFSRLLEAECRAKFSRDADHYLDRIRKGVQQMGLLVDDLLNLARIGRRPLERRETDLNQLVQIIIDELEQSEPDRKVSWMISSLPSVNCDPHLVRIAFQNLISNALKFTRPRASAVIEMGTRKQNGDTAIFIRDNGVGFDAAHADKLFGVFQRLHRQDEFEGTGIGLATVQRIVQRHGGTIWAESAPNQGAAFFFTLPSHMEVSYEAKGATNG